MTKQEKTKIAKERRQVRAFLATIRTENNAIGKRLAGMIVIFKSIRATHLEIDFMLTQFEKKVKKEGT